MQLFYRETFIIRIVFSYFLICFSLQSSAAIHPKQQEANPLISKLYHRLDKLTKPEMSARLREISAEFLGKPYLLGALGEGINARYDQETRYRSDAFDCDTYVTTVLALALGKNPQGFQRCLKKIRYQHGKVDFISRNHFMSLDWNPNNQRQGFIRDITLDLKNKNHQSPAKIARALIDKASWYQHLSIKSIRLVQPDEKERSRRLVELQLAAAKLPPQIAEIPYIPFTALFDKQGKANQYLFRQIPNASIVEIVRPNWNLREKIGTNLNVSHLGFAFWENGILYFRQASSQYGQVVEVPLIEYLRKASLSPTIKGINIEIVIPQEPLSEGC